MYLPMSAVGRVSLYSVEIAIGMLIAGVLMGDIVFGRVALGALMVAFVACWWSEVTRRRSRLSSLQIARYKRRLRESRSAR